MTFLHVDRIGIVEPDPRDAKAVLFLDLTIIIVLFVLHHNSSIILHLCIAQVFLVVVVAIGLLDGSRFGLLNRTGGLVGISLALAGSLSRCSLSGRDSRSSRGATILSRDIYSAAHEPLFDGKEASPGRLDILETCNIGKLLIVDLQLFG